MNRIIKRNGSSTYDTSTLVVDSDDDLSNINIGGVSMGSTVYSIASGYTYILSGSGAWVKKSGGNGSTSSYSSDSTVLNGNLDGGLEI